MLYTHKTPQEKRQELRRRLDSGEFLRFPGSLNPLSARLIERKGFDGVYISGGVIAAELGVPDIGITTLTEVTDRGAQVSRVTDLPTIIDADTGFGGTVNIARTVQAIEDAGISGFHIEDQVNPKRCGHLDGKSVVSEADAQERVGAAVAARRDPNLLIIARTDIRAVDGFDATVRRSRALVEAGADVIFPEALRTLEEFEAVRSAVDVPLLANMTEFGKSELFSADQLRDIGIGIVIWPVTLLRMAMGAVERALDTLLSEGHVTSRLGEMQHRADLYELLDYASYNQFDSSLFNFTIARENEAAAPHGMTSAEKHST